MNGLKKLALAVSLSCMASTAALASTGDPIIDFDSTAIPGSGVDQLDAPYQFSYDDFLISDDGETVITQTDTDNSGGLTPGDAFSEFTVVSTSAFRLDGDNINSSVSGVNFEYDLITTLTLGGFVVPSGLNTFDIFFTSGSGEMVYDEAPRTTGIDPVAIANLNNPVSGSCRVNLDNIETNNPDGACVIIFDFESLYSGLFIAQKGGDLFGNDLDKLRVDINIDEVAGLLELLAGGYEGYNDTCGGDTGLALCSAAIDVTHNGSARHVVPAPGTLVLLGLGLLGFSRMRRKHVQ